MLIIAYFDLNDNLVVYENNCGVAIHVIAGMHRVEVIWLCAMRIHSMPRLSIE